MRKKQLGYLLLVLAAMGLSIATILMRLIPQTSSLKPVHVAIWRFTIAAPLTWLVMAFRKSSREALSQPVWRFLGLGAIYSVASFCAVFALGRLSSSLYVIVLFIYPSLVILYSLFKGKSIPRFSWLGVLMTFLGLILTVFEFGKPLTIDVGGFLITLLNALAMAAYLIMSERILGKEKGRLSGSKWVLTGALFAGAALIPFLGFQSPRSWVGWGLLLTFGIFGTMIPIFLMNIGLQLVGAARGSVVVTLQPVLTVFISTLFLGDVLTLQQWLGGALVISAIVLLLKTPKGEGTINKVDYDR